MVLGGVGVTAPVLLSGCTGFMTTKDNMIDVSAPPGAIEGTLRLGSLEFPCMLGRSGIVSSKREGDGGTPAGLFALRELRYRADRLPAPTTQLPVHATRESDGWCDDPNDPAYNKLVALPYKASAEKMWRGDNLYDVLAVIGYNDSPPVPGLGSAIFMHVARDLGNGKLGPTVGCVSLSEQHLLTVLAQCTSATKIRIRPT